MGILGLLAAIILAVLFGYFTVLNQDPVTLKFFSPIPPQHAYLHEIIGYSAIVGVLFSGFLALGPLMSSWRTVRALRRQVRALEEQVKTLREAPGAAPFYSGNSSALAPVHSAQIARADEEPV